VSGAAVIELGLVYICSTSPAGHFVGCGALVEGGYIATCRHVWRAAIASESAETGAPPEVEVEFPFARHDRNGRSKSRAALADDCVLEGEPAPDLVLLKPESIPSSVMTLQLAREAKFEVGPGHAGARLQMRDIIIRGTILGRKNAKGLRAFKADQSQGYWFEKGSSGSPVFLEGGQQLAGIIALSELGANEGESHLREAFVVPAMTINRYLGAMIGRRAVEDLAEKKGINPVALQQLLAELGHMDVPHDKIAERLYALVEDILAQAAKPVPVSNDGDDIDAAVAASRAKLGALDTAGALDVLRAKIAEEVDERARRLVPLMKEQAAVEQLAFDYEAAKKTLTEVTRLVPEDVWAFIVLGDLYVSTGPLEDAAKAFRHAEAAARRQVDGRDLSVSFNRLGDVQQAQGDLAAALKSYQAGLAIAERLAKADPGNAGWQRDLSVTYERIGNVQMGQGDLAGALKSYSDSLAIAERLANSDPGNAPWQRDLSVSYDRIGDVQKAQGNLAATLKSFSDSLAIRERLAKVDPGNAGWQRDLSVSYEKIGGVRQAQGDFASALKSFSDSLAIVERLARSDPGNAGWQRDLSVSYNKTGEMQVEQGDFASALKSISDSLAIAERLARSDPGNAGWQRDLAMSFGKLALLHKKSGDAAKARDFLRQGQAIMSRLTKLSPDNAVWKQDLAGFDKQIKELAP
jgi:tetratricopeptide (TPR) repeat protein